MAKSIVLPVELKDQATGPAIKIGQTIEDLGKKSDKTSRNMGELADNVGRTATKLARSADTFGLPTAALRGLDDAMEVAEMGLGNLTKGVAGLNMASVGVAGAGLAIGAVIGGWLRDIPAVAAAADKAAAALYRMFAGAPKQDKGFSPDELLKISAAHDRTKQSMMDTIKTQHDAGTSIEDLKQVYKGMEPEIQKYIDKLGEQDKAAKQAADTARQLAEAEKRKKYEETVRILASTMDASAANMKQYYDDEKKRADDTAKRIIEDYLKAMEAKGKAAQDEYNMEMDMQAYAEKAEAAATAKELQHKQQQVAAWQIVGAAIGSATAFLEQLGVTADSTTGKMLGLAEAGAQLGASIASGDPAAIIGSSFNVLGSIVGLFHDKVIEQLNDQRDAWFQQQGGVEALERSLNEMGQTGDQVNVIIKQLYDAKTPDEFAAAVQRVNDAIDTGKQAQQDLDAAVQKYGFTLDELGPKFKQQKLDQQAADLLKDFNLLTASGIDQGVVIGKMADNINEYVQQAMKAGGTVPEQMRPILEQMLKAGELTDAAGNKMKDLSSIHFSESLTESMSRAVDEIAKLTDAIRALAGLPPINIPVNVPQAPGVPAGTNGPPPGAQHYAGGGIAWHPQVAYIGERGPEAVVPLRGGGSFGTTIHAAFTFNGVTSAEDIIAEITKHLPLNTGGLTTQITKWTATALPHG